MGRRMKARRAGEWCDTAARCGPTALQAHSVQQTTEDAQLKQALAASRASASFEDAELLRAIEASQALVDEQEALESAIAQSTALHDALAFSGGHQPSLGSKILAESGTSVQQSFKTEEPSTATSSNSFASSSSYSKESVALLPRSWAVLPPSPKFSAPPGSLASSVAVSEDEGLAMMLRASKLASLAEYEAENAALEQAIAASLLVDGPLSAHGSVCDIPFDHTKKSVVEAESVGHAAATEVGKPETASFSSRHGEEEAKPMQGSWQSGLFEAAKSRALEIEAPHSMAPEIEAHVSDNDWFGDEADDWLLVASADDQSPMEFSMATPPDSPK
jgi:hypothetical protein